MPFRMMAEGARSPRPGRRQSSIWTLARKKDPPEAPERKAPSKAKKKKRAGRLPYRRNSGLHRRDWPEGERAKPKSGGEGGKWVGGKPPGVRGQSLR